MNRPIRQLDQMTAASEDALPPELVRIIEALAEAQARKDYAARYPDPERA
jgi:hypothetical protein